MVGFAQSKLKTGATELLGVMETAAEDEPEAVGEGETEGVADKVAEDEPEAVGESETEGVADKDEEAELVAPTDADIVLVGELEEGAVGVRVGVAGGLEEAEAMTVLEPDWVTIADPEGAT